MRLHKEPGHVLATSNASSLLRRAPAPAPAPLLEACIQATPVACWTAASIAKLSKAHRLQIETAIDALGELSQHAQNLDRPITSTNGLRTSDHRLFLFVEGDRAYALLRVGGRKLFIHDKDALMHEIEPCCCLDFYVHESQQRRGVGLQLFSHMLQVENRMAHQLGYDSPSPKLLSFLRKHYRLSEFVPQNNRFVVFNAYFSGNHSSYSASQPVVPRHQTQLQTNRQRPSHPHRHQLHLSSQVASILHNSVEPSPLLRPSIVSSLSCTSSSGGSSGSSSGSSLRRCNEPPSQLLGFRFRDSMDAASPPHRYDHPSLSAHPKLEQWQQAQRPLDYIMASIDGARERLQNSENKLAEHSSQPAAISIYGENRHNEWSKSDTIKRIHGRS